MAWCHPLLRQIQQESSLHHLNSDCKTVMIHLTAHLTHEIKCVDNFNIFFNCKDRFKPDGVHPNIAGSKLLSTHLHHTVPSPDLLLHITQGIQRMCLFQSGSPPYPLHPTPQSKEEVKTARLKLSQLDELLNSNNHRHHHSDVYRRWVPRCFLKHTGDLKQPVAWSNNIVASTDHLVPVSIIWNLSMFSLNQSPFFSHGIPTAEICSF